MNVLFCAPLNVGMYGRTGGVLTEMRTRERSIVSLGHEVSYLDPWRKPDFASIDVCHLFMANNDTLNLAKIISKQVPLVVSPIIDRHESNLSLRAKIIYSMCLIGAHTHLGSCREICSLAHSICFRSQEEKQKCRDVLGVSTQGMIALCPVLDFPTPGPVSARIECLVEKPYVLFVGDYSNPRKNIKRLISAVNDTGLRLIIAGMASRESVAAEIHDLASGNPAISIVGEVSQEDKYFLSKNARVVALPSLVEGIGLSAVEAAVLGTTVVVTKNGGSYDYFGDGAYYVDPQCTSSIKRVLLQAAKTPKDCSRELIAKLSGTQLAIDLENIYKLAIEIWKRL